MSVPEIEPTRIEKIYEHSDFLSQFSEINKKDIYPYYTDIIYRPVNYVSKFKFKYIVDTVIKTCVFVLFIWNLSVITIFDSGAGFWRVEKEYLEPYIIRTYHLDKTKLPEDMHNQLKIRLKNQMGALAYSN